MAEVTISRIPTASRGRIRDPLASATVVRMRLWFAVVIGASIALLPVFGPHRVLLGCTVLVLSAASNLHALHVIRRTNQPPSLLGIADVALMLMVVAITPAAMAVATLIAAGGLTLYVLWYGRRIALGLGLLYEIGLVVIGIVHQPQWWVATVIAFALVTIGSTNGLSDLATAAVEAQERYLSMVNGLDAVVWEADAEDNTLFVSGNIDEVLGTSRESFARPGFYYSRVHPADVAILEAAREARARGEVTDTRIRIRDDSGAYRRIQDRQKVSLNPDGTVRLRRGLVVDETERWVAESDLRRYMDFIRGIPVALVVLRLVDPDDPGSIEVVLQNPAASALVHGAEHRRLIDLLPLNSESLRELAEVALGGRPMERPFVELPGSDAVFAVRAVPLPEHHVGVTVEDITKRARLADSFRHQALHDELTGLPNRAHFRKRLAEALQEDPDRPAALLLVDLDQFKEINDTLGHHYGDRLLREFSQRLVANLRGCDIIARLGGDEFAILLTDGPDERSATEVAERLLKLCAARFVVDDFRFHVGASVGIALAPDHAQDSESLLRKADTAMYRAKERGGGWWVYSRHQDDRDVRRLELMSDLRDAIESGQLQVHYQPRIDLAGAVPVGLEALVRWNHPVHGLLAPEEFIELAEVSGCIGALTRFVTTRAVHETADLLTDGALVLSVNLSSRNLHDPALVEWLRELLGEARIGEGQLCFEITETELMEDPTRAMRTLEEVRAMGVRFSVDDFGTGYSSLAYLRQLPIDEVKIDRSFVADLAHDDTIVRAVIDLAHNLGLDVVAEGVEEGDTEARLRDLGCDSAQGFHWSTPMPVGDLRRWLSAFWTGAPAG